MARSARAGNLRQTQNVSETTVPRYTARGFRLGVMIMLEIMTTE